MAGVFMVVIRVIMRRRGLRVWISCDSMSEGGGPSITIGAEALPRTASRFCGNEGCDSDG